MFEGGGESFFEFLSHAVQAPVVELAVLSPFEIANGDAAGVGEDIGEHDFIGVVKDFVGIWMNRRVGRFDDDGCLDAGGVLFGDNAADRCGDEHIDIEFEQLLIGDMLGFGEAFQESVVGD